MMLELLETGKALYALTAVCVLGILSRLVARNLYKRLIKETDNMTLTKNRYLRELKQKTENTYRLNQGIHNTKAYLEKQLTNYRFLGVSLNGWGNLSGQLTVLCFFLGGMAAFGAYWYRCDSYFVALYGSVGVLAGLLTLFLDYGVNLGERRNQLLNALQDYMENSLFHRLARETASAMEETVGQVSREVRGSEKGAHNRSVRGVTTRDSAIRQVPERDRVFGDLNMSERDSGDYGMRNGDVDSETSKESIFRRQKPGRATSPRTRRARYGSEEAESLAVDREDCSAELSRRNSKSIPQGADSIRDVDYLRRSLEQIAASREKHDGEGDWIKELSPKDLEKCR